MQPRLTKVSGRALPVLVIAAFLIRPLELSAQKPFVTSATLKAISLSHSSDPDSSRFLLFVKIANLPHDSLATKHLKVSDIVVTDRDGVRYTPQGYRPGPELAVGIPIPEGQYFFLVQPKGTSFELRLPGDAPRKFVAAVSLKP